VDRQTFIGGFALNPVAIALDVGEVIQ